jgi:hypothetical protein
VNLFQEKKQNKKNRIVNYFHFDKVCLGELHGLSSERNDVESIFPENIKNEMKSLTLRPQMKRRILFTLMFSALYFLIIGYLDVNIVTPSILPEDECYYHVHETPLWVDLFYMSSMNNGHPSINLTHIIILLAGSVFLGNRTARLCS